MKLPDTLIDKYNIPVPRYTSYPPANFFSDSFGTDDYLKAIEQSNNEDPQNISIYIHIPFCSQLCLYCGCNTHITKDRSLIEQYVKVLKTEFKIIRPLLNKNRKVSQIHWGGGTPNILSVNLIGEIMEYLISEFSFIENPEIAIECNPAHLNHNYIEKLAAYGFTRISLGIQDFKEDVLKAVHREIPLIPVKELSSIIRECSMALNLDLIYGLPLQSAGSFESSIKSTIECNPDRLVTFSYAHVPWVKPAQKKLEKIGLPSPDEKVKMFETAWKLMTGAGYIPIGLDHYAKPDDDMAIALGNKSLHRNFQGYCTRETTGQVYAFGVTGISQLESVYAQNTYKVNEYIGSIAGNKIVIVKGYELSRLEKIIRDVINEIMCNNYLSWERISNRFEMTSEQLKGMLDFHEDKLSGFRDDGLLEYNNKEIIISSTGRFFLRNIAAVFDVNIADPSRKYSKSV